VATSLTARIVGPQADEFKIQSDGCGQRKLESNAGCVVVVAFAPTSLGDRSAELQLGADNARTESVALTGSAPFQTSAIVTPPGGTVFCPANFTSVATITYSGSGGTFHYVWMRSDGGTSAGQVTFSGSGVQQVTTTWTLNQSFRGWEQLRIQESNIASDQAIFGVDCIPPIG